MREAKKIDYQQQLINGIKTNDSVILKDFYKSNYRKIENLVLNNSGTVEHAKDIYKEAFITVWKRVKNETFIPKNETALQGYLYQIAKNKWMDFLRSKTFKKTETLFEEQPASTIMIQ